VSSDPHVFVLAADVKCYYCGHISGQIVGPRNGPLKLSNFVPRPGYRGPAPKPGMRMRCERCHGPVFLEDAEPIAMKASAARALNEAKKPPRAA
jgi:hypothetical protein